MNRYIVDTIALVRYLDNNLPKKADKVFKQAEQLSATLLIPDIVIGEYIYISLKGRLNISDPMNTIRESLLALRTTRYIELVSMSFDAWDQFLDIDIPELHDRMICALARYYHAEIITNDEEIAAVARTIWK